MPSAEPDESDFSQHHGNFPTTRWTLIQSAQKHDGPAAEAALAELCRIYWMPLYWFARRRGLDHHAAQDSTQGFFAGALEGGLFERADEASGRLRTFLLTAFTRFIGHEERFRKRWKRGGRTLRVPLELAEELPAATMPPEEEFDRNWSRAIVDESLRRLGQQEEAAGHGLVFRALRPFLAGSEGALTIRNTALHLDLPEGKLRVALHRMRKRCRKLIEDLVMEGLSHPSPETLADELNVLRIVPRGENAA